MTIRWRYLAEDASGRVVRGDLVAADNAGVLAALKAERLKPIEVRKERVGHGLVPGRSRIGIERLAKFSRALSDLLVSGIPVGAALDIVARRERHAATQAFVERLTRQVRAGTALSAALKADPAEPPRLMVALAVAGEASGTLGAQLALLADSLEATARLRREMISQLIYPAALFVLVLATVAFLSWFVLPEFEKVFQTSETRVPPETKFVLGAGAWIRGNGIWLPAISLAAAAGTVLALRRFGDEIERFAFSVPVLGPHLRQVEAGRYCRTLGTLLLSGVPLARALPVAEEVVGAKLMREALEVVARDVKSGKALAPSLDSQSVLNPDTVTLIELGERTGRLGEMLLKAAAWNEGEARTLVARAAALLGPLMTVIMGLVVAGVIAAVMSGVLSLNEAVG